MIISPQEASDNTYNRKMMEYFGAKIIECPVTEVHDTIEQKLAELCQEGWNPYLSWVEDMEISGQKHMYNAMKRLGNMRNSDNFTLIIFFMHLVPEQHRQD